ncbi:MAG TPA: DUF2332 family protein [Solirubrobacterales bacterium]|nr:DUF2332 family protein [Solirubrobacterales bacterium]
MVEPSAACRIQAGHCARLGSALYAGLLERVAVDAEEGGPAARILGDHAHDPPDSMLALRLMGAVHRRVLEGAHPGLGDCYSRGLADDEAWAAFRRVLVEDFEAIRALLDRPVQTNEVGRCAALLFGFLAVAKQTGMPLRLLEVGASAGLNLRWDRYRYEGDGFAWGDPGSPVRVGFEIEGDPPRTAAVEVAARAGCDLRPLDPASEEGRLTLLSFVWADQAVRLDRLRAALSVAGGLPVAVARSGAAEWIAERLSGHREGVATVVFHSIVMQYLPAAERQRFEDLMLAAGERATVSAPLAWLRMEPAGEYAEVRLTFWPGGEERLLAGAGYHGDPVKPSA